MRVAIRAGALTATCVAGLLAGCSAKQSGTPPPVTATVTVAASPSHPGTSASSTPSPTPTPTLVRALPGDCDSLLPQYDVQQASGLKLPGKTAFVVGVPEKNIGRIGYLNCRYDVTGTTPQLEIGVSLYDTPAQAATRLRGTVDDYASHGATSGAVTVAGHPGTLLTGGSGQGYDVPLLVVGVGQRTVAVSLANGATSASTLPTVLTKIATLALQRTGG